MNITGLIFLGAGYLLGNPKAREDCFSGIQSLMGKSIDALNKMGGEPNASKADTVTTEE